MSRVLVYSRSLLLVGLLLALGGCSGRSPDPEKPMDQPSRRRRGEFSIAWTDLVAFLVPTDQDAKGKTAEQALAELHKGMVEDPQTLALLRRLNADLSLELEVIPPAKDLTTKDEKQQKA